MMGGWRVQQCQDSSFQEVKSVSSRFPRGCSTWELQLPAPCIHEAEDGRAGKPWLNRENVREKEYIETTKKKDMPSIISSAQYKGRFSLSKEISWGYTGKHKDRWMSAGARHEERHGKWKLVKIKDCHSLYWKDQIWLIEDMREMMKQGNEKKCEDTLGQRESRQN